MWYIVYDVYSKRYFVDIGVRKMLTKAICYIKARYRVHQMLKRYPTLNQSSTLAWKIPWMEEPGRLKSMGSRRVGHD